MTSNLTLASIKEFGGKLRKFLFEQSKNIPEEYDIKKGEVSRVSHIKTLKAMLPDWAVEIAELSFKNQNMEIHWDLDFLEALEFTRPIL